MSRSPAQIEYCLEQRLGGRIEYTDDPHPRNTYWEMFGNPMFDIRDAAGIMTEISACRKTFPSHYIKVNAFDSTRGRGVAAAVVHRQPAGERARLRAGAPGRPHGRNDALHDRRAYATEQARRRAVLSDAACSADSRIHASRPSRPAAQRRRKSRRSRSGGVLPRHRTSARCWTSSIAN